MQIRYYIGISFLAFILGPAFCLTAFVLGTLVFGILVQSKAAGAESSPAQIAEYGNATSPAVAEEVVLESLYRMGLYSVAVERCEGELDRSGLDRLGTARWTARLIVALALRDSVIAASSKPSTEQSTIEFSLKNASVVAKPYLEGEKPDVHAFWVRFALFNAFYRVTDRQVATFLAAPADVQRQEDCLDSLRKLSDSLAKFRDDVQNAMSIASKQTTRDTGRLGQDYATLRNRVLLMQIDAVLLRGHLYEAESNDAVAAGTEASLAIEKAIESTEEQWSGRAALELARWQAMQIVGRNKEVLVGLQAWVAKYPTHPSYSKAIAIAIEACLATHQLSDCDKWIQMGDSQLASNGDPELAIAKLATAISRLQHKVPSESDTTNVEIEAQFEALLRQRDEISALYGLYWGFRAEAIILKSESSSGAKGRLTNDKSPTAESMAMIRLQLKQLLAANRVSDAIDRLRQSEAMALKNQNLEQAFELAKLQIGLLAKSSNSLESANDQSPSEKLVAVAQQVEASAATYAEINGAAELNQFAESLLLDSWKAESDLIQKDRRWKRYEQHLLEHIEQWPESATSENVRSQLAASYLATGRLEHNLRLWSQASSKSTDSDERFVNAFVLFKQLNNSASIVDESISRLNQLSPPWKQLADLLLADWKWWTVDAGTQGLLSSSQQANAASVTNEEKYLPLSMVALFQKAAALDITSHTKDSIETSTRLLCEALEKDPINHIGLALTSSSVLVAMIEDRYVFGKEPISELNRQVLSKSLLQYEEALNRMESDLNKLLHPSVLSAIQDAKISMGARGQAILSKTSEDAGKAIRKLIDRQASSPRNAKWSRELAVIQMWVAKSEPSIAQPAIEKGIQSYLQLANGSPVGSDNWFEARIRLANCYQLLGKQEQATQAIALTVALIGEPPAIWISRLKHTPPLY